MARLNGTAKDTLRDWGITPAAWAWEWFDARSWHGDVCGCPDDRCIGFHHDSDEDCGCLLALLQSREGQGL